MPKQIQVENQIIEFPDNMPDNEIEAVIKREFYSQQQPQQLQQNQALQQQQRQQRERQQVANEEGRIGSLFTTATNILPGMARAKALSAALGAKAMGGDETIGNFYDEALKNELTKLSVAREKYPIQSLASELVSGIGGLKTIGAGGKVLSKVATKSANTLKSVNLGSNVATKAINATGNVATKAINKVGDAAKYLGKNDLIPILASGGLLGATYAAGETPDLTSKQAIKDAATGGALGVVGGAVVKGAGAVGSVIGKTAKTIKNTINPSASKVLQQVFTPELAQQEASKLSNKIAEGRITTLSEQGGDVALDLTRLVGKIKGGDKILQNYYNTKSAGSAKRIIRILENNLSAKKYFDNLDTLIARRKELADPIRQKAYEEGKNIPKLFEYAPSTITTAKSIGGSPATFIIDHATGKKIDIGSRATFMIDYGTGKKIDIPAKIGKTITTTRTAIKKQAITEYGGKFLSLKDRDIGFEFDNLIEDQKIKQYINSSIKDNEIQAPINSVEMLHDVRKQIDRDINGLYNVIESKQASFNSASSTQSELSALNSLKKRLNNFIYKVSPSMKDHDKIYADSFALERSHKEGLNFSKYSNAKELKRYFNPLPEGQKEAFIIGVVEDQFNKILKSSDTNPAKAIFGNQLQRDKLKVLFKNPQEYTNFGKRLNDEMRVIQTKQKIVGGTNDFNLQEGSEILNKVANNAISYKTFGAANVLLMTKDAIRKKYYGLNENVAKELAQILIKPKRSVEELNKIANKSKTTIEKKLIKKFANDYLISKNITNAIATTAGKLSAQQQEE